MPNELYPDLSLTNFPSSVDQFTSFLNVVATDGALIARYQAAMEAGNTTEANQILGQIPNATRKIITATSLNTLSQAMLAIERFYSTDIEPYINGLQQDWLTTIQQFSYKGVWASGTNYMTNNLVSYTVSGMNFIYIATSNPPIGTNPTNTSYWRLLTVQGQQGVSGEGLSYRQEWSSGTSYTTGDTVTYDGAIYMAIQNSQNRQPSSNEDYWTLIMTLQNVSYPIQDTVPANLAVDGLWFNTADNPTGYVRLDPLANPATAANIVLGYEAYDDNGNVIVGEFDMSSLLPVGIILMWSGAEDGIPDKWALCNGQNGTPDLRGKFVLGVSDSYAVGATGGEETHALTVAELAAHTHNFNLGYTQNRNISSGGTREPYDHRSEAPYATITSTSTGSGSPHNNMPPYYALCYIMYLGVTAQSTPSGGAGDDYPDQP